MFIILGQSNIQAQPAPKTYTKFCVELTKDDSGFEAGGQNFWKKPVLNVRFLEGTPFLQGKVRQFSVEWSKYANINFAFLDERSTEPADIRITFDTHPNAGSWSYIGTDTETNQKIPTMNYGWFDENTGDVEFRRTILHEFGHALGLTHEHLSPVVGIDWAKDVVYADYFSSQKWKKEKVDQNVFNKYSKDEIQYTQYDPTSIMHYSIPKEHLRSGTPVGWNTELSELDKLFIASVYPLLNLSVHKVDEKDNWGPPTDPVKTTLELSTGQQIGIRVGTRFDLFAYILGFTKEGTFLMYPRKSDHSDAKLSTRGPKPFKFRLTGAPGPEEIIVIVSRTKIANSKLADLITAGGEWKIPGPPEALPSVEGIGVFSNLSCNYAEKWFGGIFDISCASGQQPVGISKARNNNVAVNSFFPEGKVIFRVAYQHIAPK